jgi:hypothetical protein
MIFRRDIINRQHNACEKKHQKEHEGYSSEAVKIVKVLRKGSFQKVFMRSLQNKTAVKIVKKFTHSIIANEISNVAFSVILACPESLFTIPDKQEGFPTSLPTGQAGGKDNTKG